MRKDKNISMNTATALLHTATARLHRVVTVPEAIESAGVCKLKINPHLFAPKDAETKIFTRKPNFPGISLEGRGTFANNLKKGHAYET